MHDIVWFVLIGLATGLLARTLMKGGKFGILGDVFVGILGAVLGTLLFRLTLDEAGGFWASAVVALGGAALLVLDLRLLQKSFAERFVPGAFRTRCPFVVKSAPPVSQQPGPGPEPTRVCGPEESDGTVQGMTQCTRSNLYRSP